MSMAKLQLNMPGRFIPGEFFGLPGFGVEDRDTAPIFRREIG